MAHTNGISALFKGRMVGNEPLVAFVEFIVVVIHLFEIVEPTASNIMSLFCLKLTQKLIIKLTKNNK